MRVSKKQAKSMGLLDEPKKVNPYAPFKSQWEKEYAGHLLAMTLSKEIVDYRYERASFVLVPASETQRGVRYVPDFLVIYPDGRMEIHEVKGHWRPGAKHKVKSLANLIKPIPVYVVRKEKGVWTRERF